MVDGIDQAGMAASHADHQSAIGFNPKGKIVFDGEIESAIDALES